MRRRRSPVREIIPDARYNSVMVTRLINSIMLDGKKSIIGGVNRKKLITFVGVKKRTI